MLDIAQELKDIYKNDLIPLVNKNVHKELKLFFPSLNLMIENDRIDQDSFELTERLCSTDDLTLGSCEGAIVKIKVANITLDVNGQTFILTQYVSGYTMPLGTYKVESALLQDDNYFREIVAYDTMKSTDVDVSAWYNGLVFPLSVKAMRESLLTYLGIEFTNETLVNDAAMLSKTISPASLIGRDVLRKLSEINAGFGHITRENKFKTVQLSGLGLYPSETLYPQEDLFPSESSEFLATGYKTTRYAEYIVEQITKLQIRQEDGDEGVTVGVDGNQYTITENFLLYGRTDLEEIANNILDQIKNKFYRPHTTVCMGLPYVEVGDALTIITPTDAIETFVFTRTLKGIQALEDEYTATGNQKRLETSSLSTQVQQLKGRTLKLRKSVEGISVNLSDLETNTSEQFELTNGQIILKVDSNGKVVSVALGSNPSDGSSIKIKADNLSVEGLVTVNGKSKFNLDGTFEAVNGKFSGEITSSSATITGGSIDINTANETDDIIKLNYGKLSSAMKSSGFITSNGTSYSRIGYATSTFTGTVSIATVEPDKIQKLTGTLDIKALTINLDGYVEVVQTLKCYKKVTALAGLTVNGTYSDMLDVNSSTVKVGNTSCYVGFFGSGGSSKRTVYPIAVPSSATTTTNAQKINEVINALKSYGLM